MAREDCPSKDYSVLFVLSNNLWKTGETLGSTQGFRDSSHAACILSSIVDIKLTP